MNPFKNLLGNGIALVGASFIQYILGVVLVLGWSNGVYTEPLIFVDENPSRYWQYLKIEFGAGIFFLTIFFLKEIWKKAKCGRLG